MYRATLLHPNDLSLSYFIFECNSYDSLSPQSSNIQATEENSLTLANLMIKPNLMNSSSSSLTNSPRAYKKLLLDKAVNELGIIHSPNTNNNNDESNDIHEIKHEFELIDENMYLFKKLV